MPNDFVRCNGYHQPEPSPGGLGKLVSSAGAFIRQSFPWTKLELVYEETKGNEKLAQPQLGITGTQTAVPGENILIQGSRGITGECVVQGRECGQASAKATVRAAGHIPSRGRTGDAEAGASRPALPGP